jgi:hypothetical protein
MTDFVVRAARMFAIGNPMSAIVSLRIASGAQREQVREVHIRVRRGLVGGDV